MTFYGSSRDSPMRRGPSKASDGMIAGFSKSKLNILPIIVHKRRNDGPGNGSSPSGPI